MSTIMAKAPKKAVSSGDGTAKPISFRPSAVVAAGLDEFRNQFDFKPDKSAVIERALLEFLASKGIEIPDSDE